jgi:Tol biopolymer transport system component
MKYFLMIVCLFTGSVLLAQSGSEILLFDLKVGKNKVTISNPKNVTQHKGYDNQPSFHTDHPLLYYSSFNEEGRADIISYHYKTGETKAITKTSEREYSPTLTPDKSSLSCIIQRDNGAQDLGKYPVQGGDASVIIDNMTVGYHAWADNSHIALFILGEPHTLHYLRLPTKEDTVLAQNIGRSLHKIPGERAVSFIQKADGNTWEIKKLESETMKISKIANTLPGREDIAWTADKKIISSDGTKIYFLDPAKGEKWMEVTVQSGIQLLKGVTRLAINSKGDKLAVVVAE